MSDLPPDTPGSQLPADYYSSPRTEAERVVPRWVTMGCGAVALVVLLALFAGGAFVGSGHAGQLVDLWFETLQGELLAQTERDVPAEQKNAFTAEFSTLRQKVRGQKVKADELLPLMQAMMQAQTDHRVTREELTDLTRRLHTINTHP